MDYKRFKLISSFVNRTEWVEDDNGTKAECDWEDLEELMDKCDRLERDNKDWEMLYDRAIKLLDDLNNKIASGKVLGG